MTDFEAIGFAPAIIAAARAVGWSRPTSLQAAAAPTIRRGGNVVLHASSGAGVTGAWALPLLDRLAADEATDVVSTSTAPRVLVVTATADRAVELAGCLGRLADGTPLQVRASAAGWRTDDADLLAGSATTIARGIAGAAIKLGSVQSLVIDGLSTVFGLAGVEPLDAIMVSLPADAQRVLVTGERDADIDRFIEAHARRALTFPPRPADPTLAGPVEQRGGVAYLGVAEREKPATLARLLARAEGRVRIATRSADRAAAVRDALARRGLEADVAPFDLLDSVRIAYDVPTDADDAARLELDAAVVLVRPRELPHLRRVAAEAGLVPSATSEKEPGGALARYREAVRRAVREQDLDAQLLILEPLFDEFAASELAAALSALLRERPREQERGPAPRRGPAEPQPQPGLPPRPPSFVRLFVSAGSRDNVRPADIVGAFTGEARIDGDQIGRIDVRDTFSVVEIDAGVADRVIRALNGTTMRGRALRVDYDRRGPGAPAARRPSRTRHRPPA